jgi:hypothetical protein
MEMLIQLIAWLLFGFIGFRWAEKLNVEHGMNFDARIWAAIGFLLGLIGLAGLGIYGHYKIRHKGE